MTLSSKPWHGDEGPQVWITGIGLVSSLGEGADAHWQRLGAVERPQASLKCDDVDYCPVHPLASIDFSAQIPLKADFRQMGQWQRIGVYAAGLALADAGIAGQADVLKKTHLNVAAGNGERDGKADRAVLEALATRQTGSNGAVSTTLNEALLRELRPTLYLGELSNLLAGNISIVHGVTGSSRTFKGEEMAGVSAVEDAVKRIAGGACELFLVGGAANGERTDLMLNYEICGALWRSDHRPVWERAGGGGGLILGSLGAFLLLESDAHARARGRRPYARVAGVSSGRRRGTCRGPDVSIADSLFERLRPRIDEGPLPVLSGASGVEPATGRELGWLHGLTKRGLEPCIRAYGTMLGHGVEAHFPAGLALSALALSRGAFFPPFDASGNEGRYADNFDRVLVTGWGHWRGEGIALVESLPAH
jgi:3-oxoacyl-[acyl-carrier-protein] synthase II